MNVKYWLLAATLFNSACLDMEDDKEEEEESEPTSEPSEPTSEPNAEPASPCHQFLIGLRPN